MKNERTRDWRRHRTECVVKRRKSEYLTINHFSFENRRVEESGRMRKLSPFNCNCRKRSKNNPHCGGGICHMMQTPVVLERRDGDRQCREWLWASMSDYLLDADPESTRSWIDRTW